MCDTALSKISSDGRSSIAAWTLKLSFGLRYFWNVAASGLCLITRSLIALLADPRKISNGQQDLCVKAYRQPHSPFPFESNTTSDLLEIQPSTQAVEYSGGT